MKNMKNMEYSSDDQFSTTKYIIKIKYTIKGLVNIMDIIGALFGQTEGLLNDLELRELQKTGRIGRIQVQNANENGNSVGEIMIPSSLDRVETAILAATIESVDRVGPCTAQMHLAEIVDIREDKRKKIMDRATELLQKWDLNTPEAEEMGESILDKMRTGELVEYGPEKLPAGQDLETAQQVIIVEGIADVKGMMRAGFRNAIGTNGTSIPKSIIDLSKKKSCIAFVDGDRGGEMILNELLEVADIDFIAIAPKGLMVEELTRKEIIKHLQNKKTLQEWLAEKEKDKKHGSQRPSRKPSRQDDSQRRRKSQKATSSRGKDQRRKPHDGHRDQRQQTRGTRPQRKDYSRDKSRQRPTQKKERAPPAPVDAKIVEHMKSVLASNEVIGLTGEKEQSFRVGNTKVLNTLNTAETTKILILDGVITQRLVDKAGEKNIDEIYAINCAKNLEMPPNKKIELRLFRDYIQ